MCADTYDLSHVRALEARWLMGLPASCTLLVGLDGGPLLVTTARTVFAAAQRARYAVLTGLEWELCIEAAEANRAAYTLLEWVSHPYRPLQHVLGVHLTHRANVSNCKLTIAQVLAHFGARLVGVDPELAPHAAQGLL